MPFQPGQPKTGGRQRGTVNQLTAAFREAVLFVYDGLGGHKAFLQWARDNQTEYYKIAARLIPGEMREDGPDKHVTIILNPNCDVEGTQPALSHESVERPFANHES